MATGFRLCCVKNKRQTSIQSVQELLISVLLVKFICLLSSDVILLPDLKPGG